MNEQVIVSQKKGLEKYFSKFGRKHMLLFPILILIILSLYSLTVGVKEFNFFGLLTGQEKDVFIVAMSRLPRLISILLTGASLSISGRIMQTMMQNRFISPSTAGTMEWCRFGVMISMLTMSTQSTLIKMLVAFLFSLLGTFLFMNLLQKLRLNNTMLIPLAGMMLGNVVSSLTTFIAYKYDMVQNMSSWLQGNFSLVIKGRYELIYFGIPFLLLAYFYAEKFTIAGMGESFSKNLGLNHKVIVMVGLSIVAIITSTITVTIGSIPFVGLIIPNIVSMMMGDNLKQTLPVTAVVGGLFLLICDLIGRLIIFPYEINISVIVSVIGSFIFLILMFLKRRNKP